MLRLAAAALATSLAAAGAAAAAPPAVRLTAPADGATLVVGETAWLEWESLAPLDSRIEEWEAFLSVDGGRYYAVRLTPHLDLERRRFAFAVPDLPSAEARVLLRFGDERTEVDVELPARLRIARGPGSLVAAPSELPELGPGEPARPGDPGVVAWISGGRDGRGLSRHRTEVPPGAAPAEIWAMGAALVGAPPPHPRTGVPGERTAARVSRPSAAGLAVRPAPHPTADSLLLTGRRNE